MDNLGYTSLRLIPSYAVNPFSVDLSYFEEYIYESKETQQTLVDVETGVVGQYVTVSGKQRFIVDKQPFVKLFTMNYADLVKGLSSPAVHLLFYVFQNLKQKSEQVYIEEDLFLEEYGYKPTSKSVYYKAILELVNTGFLGKAAGMQKMFWVNPAIVYNGNRIDLIKKMDGVELKQRVKKRKS